MQNPIAGDSNNAVVNAYQFGVPGVADRVKMLMLGKMISQPAFDELRTKQQLGYVVNAVVFPHLSTLELIVIVQGAKKAPDDIDSRIEGVLTSFTQRVRNLSRADFANWKASLRSAIDQKDKNMAQEADHYWGQIVNDQFCFNRKQLALEYLDAFDAPEELATVFDGMRAHPGKISVRVFGSASEAQRNMSSAVNASASLVQKSVVVFDDGLADKQTIASDKDFWPDAAAEGACSIPKHK
jgi:insulysin